LGPVTTVYGPQATAQSIAEQHAKSITQDRNSPQAVSGPVSTCTIGGESTGVFGYSDGPNAGYHLYVVHKNFLYEIRLFGAGGLGDQAIQDALGMIGSLTWAS
jgi:hypothetical protein